MTSSFSTSVSKSAVRKVIWRLAPFVGLMYLINFMDRTAISFAGPNGMNEALGLSAAQFGFASGVFFIGYIFLEVPSNLALHKFGARRWMARIMVSWGVVAFLATFVQSFEQLTGVRFLLGIAEAGFFPGAILYLTTWVPASARPKILAIFYIGNPLSSIIGGPLAAALINLHGLWGVPGWRLMFAGVAIPAVIVGVICWFYLKDSPSEAKWLTPTEQEWLSGELANEQARTKSQELIGPGVRGALRSGRVWLLWVAFFCVTWGLYAVTFFFPTIVQGFHTQYGWSGSPLQQGVLTAIVYLPTAIAIPLWNRDSARRGVRTWHIAIPYTLGGIAAGLALSSHSPVFTLVMIALIPLGVFAGHANFWVLPPRFVTGAQAAAAVALINTANVAGFAAPYATGAIADWTGSTVVALIIPTVLMIGAGLIVTLLVRSGRIPDSTGPAAGGVAAVEADTATPARMAES